MTTTRVKKSQAKKAKPSTRTTARSGSKPAKPLLKQPQSKQQAAVAAGIFLHTDASWVTTYFDPNDLHFLDRELFG
jgi:hypothetical protein